MKATRPFLQPTALRYIEALESNEIILRTQLEHANGIIREARSQMAELLLSERLGDGYQFRAVAQGLAPVGIPPLTEEAWWRKPENQHIEVGMSEHV